MEDVLKILRCSIAIALMLLLGIVCAVIAHNKIMDEKTPDTNEIFYEEKDSRNYTKKYDQNIRAFENVSEEEYDAYIEASIDMGFSEITIESERNDMHFFKAYKKNGKEYIYLSYEKSTNKMRVAFTTIRTMKY